MPSPLLTALLALPASFGGQYSASIATSASGGWLSFTPGAGARPTLSTSIGPAGQLNLLAGNWQGRLSYNLRMSRRFELGDPVTTGIAVANVERFLMLHNFGLSGSTQLSRGWRVSVSTRASLGEIDVPSIQAVTTSGTTNTTGGTTTGGTTTGGTTTGGTSTTPSTTTYASQNGILKILTLSTSAALSGKLTRQLDFSLTGAGGFTGPLGSATDPNDPSAPATSKQGNLQLQSTLGRALSRRSSLIGTMSMSFSFADQQGTYRSILTTAGYTHRFGRYLNLSAALGVVWISQISAPAMPNALLIPPPTSSVTPAFSLSVSTQWLQLSFVTGSLSFGTGLTSQQNFVTGAFEPRIATTAGAFLSFGRDLSVGVAANLNTVAAFSPNAQGATVSQTSVDPSTQQLLTETTLSVNVPVSYRVSDGFSLTAGFAYTTYGERFASPNFAFVSPSYTFSISAAFSVSDRL